MTKVYLITAGISGFIAVSMGAVGSHLLMGNISPEHMAAFNTAVQMQMFHTLAILSLAIFIPHIRPSLINSIFYLFVAGIIFFSLPVYLISTAEVTQLSVGAISFLPPIGGISFMLGWLALIWSGVSYLNHNKSHKLD